MNILDNAHIFSDFDLSIILPFYRKLHDFEKILPVNAKYFQRNGVEVIVSMDESSEKEGLLELIKQYPFINWIVIYNDKTHEWRNPSKAINVGIKASTKKFIMVCSPESQFQTDVIYQLRYYCEYYDPCFCIGKVEFSSYGSTDKRKSAPYGSICVKREYLELVAGYSEFFTKWGAEDDNLRSKLEYKGLKKVYLEEAILIHYEEENALEKRHLKASGVSFRIKKKGINPTKNDFLNKGWGNDYANIAYSYLNNFFAKEMATEYLKSFNEYQVCQENAFSQSFKIVALIQVHNEIENISRVLKHLDEICDGIILLDDESSDDTYEMANAKKLLFKAKKARDKFDDLGNRNILLNMASFIKSDWFFFIDADEKIVVEKSNLLDLCIRNNSTAYCLYLVHLWDNENTYRIDIPEKSPVNIPGVVHRWRIFKNIGRMQINHSGRLHFPATPIQPLEKIILPFLILHYGMLRKEVRFNKYNRYLKEDTIENHVKYDYFLDEEVNLVEIKNLPSLFTNREL